MSSKSIKTLAPTQLADRLEWLMGSATTELYDVVYGDGEPDSMPTVQVLDEIKRAAEQCAKTIRVRDGLP